MVMNVGLANIGKSRRETHHLHIPWKAWNPDTDNWKHLPPWPILRFQRFGGFIFLHRSEVIVITTSDLCSLIMPSGVPYLGCSQTMPLLSPEYPPSDHNPIVLCNKEWNISKYIV